MTSGVYQTTRIFHFRQRHRQRRFLPYKLKYNIKFLTFAFFRQGRFLPLTNPNITVDLLQKLIQRENILQIGIRQCLTDISVDGYDGIYKVTFILFEFLYLFFNRIFCY